MTAARQRAGHHLSRRRWVFALLAASGVHVAALVSLRIPAHEPASRPETDVVQLAPAPDPGPRFELTPPLPPSADPPEAVSGAARPEPVPQPSAIPSVTPDAPLSRTIPPTTLRTLSAATQPLVAGPVGIGRRRVSVDAERRAIARAESLVNARMASLPGASSAPERTVTLADGGGVTVRTPWPGFLPADLKDERWRRDRCESEKNADGDKPGEAEGRGAQC